MTAISQNQYCLRTETILVWRTDNDELCLTEVGRECRSLLQSRRRKVVVHADFFSGLVCQKLQLSEAGRRGLEGRQPKMKTIRHATQGCASNDCDCWWYFQSCFFSNWLDALDGQRIYKYAMHCLWYTMVIYLFVYLFIQLLNLVIYLFRYWMGYKPSINQ